MRSIEDISKRKSEGKKKWGADLIKFVQPRLQDGLTIEEVILWLKEQYNIDIDLNEFKRIKSYYKTKAKQNTPISLPLNSVNTVQPNIKTQPQIIEQNQDLGMAEKAYQQIYGQSKKKDFDLEGL